MSKRLFFGLITIIAIIGITILIVAFGRGYRFNPETKKLESTGLLVATSIPNGAQVFVDNHLTSATNTTITLPPATYEIKITKDGYIPWTKHLKIQGEIVTKADALLLPSAPELRPLTTTGAINPTLSPDGTKIAYGVATASAQKQGLWVIDLGNRSPLSFQSLARQIVKENEFFKFSGAKLYWSPNSKQILTQFEDSFFLLDIDSTNDTPSDITVTVDLTISSWLKEKSDNEEALLRTLKPKLTKFLKENTKILSWSPDETKILYEASSSAQFPQIITPPLIGTNSQPEERDVKKERIYVYDTREDKNFFIKEAKKVEEEEETEELSLVEKYASLATPPTLRWLPDSSHLIWIEKDKINILEYDGTNKSTIFAAPFEDNFFVPFPDGTRLAILTTLNPSLTTPNLYALSLR